MTTDAQLKNLFWNYVAEEEGDSYGLNHYSPDDLQEYTNWFSHYALEGDIAAVWCPTEDDRVALEERLYKMLGIVVSVSGDPGDPDLEVAWA